MQNDESLLSGVPDFISIGGLLKASPKEEGGARILYFEASNEDVDHQNEVVLQKALADSADYFMRHGNIDLSHYSILGAKSGIPDFMTYEIGKPLAVRLDGKRTFVKSELYQGESPMAKNANMVWDSLTKQTPIARWYPSVGGSVLSKSIKLNDAGERVAVVDRVRWNNVALDRCPVNSTVPEVSTAPVGIFAKSLNGFVMKALTAGYGTDSATLTGGAALRTQSLHGAPIGYMEFRNRLAGLIRSGAPVGKGARGLLALAVQEIGLPETRATEWVGRFLRDLKDKRGG